MAKAIILSRVSTIAQQIDSQTQTIKNEAHKEGFKDEDLIIIEDKESAIKLSEEERHGLNRMKEEISKNSDITHVFIYELSRLSRRQLVLFSIRDYLISHKIQLVCCTPYFRMLENGKLSQTANLMFSIFASMAESEMELKKERMLRGKMHNKANGKNSGHLLLFGYKSLEDKTIVVDTENAIIVQEIFQTYSRGGMSISVLAEKLSNKHFVDDKFLFTKRRLAQILSNAAYCGTSEYPKIIDKSLFDKCREVAESNKSEQKHTKHKDAILKRLLFDNRGRRLSYCEERKQRYLCTYDGSISVNKEAIDKNVWELVKLLHKNYVDNKDIIREGIENDKQSYINEKVVMTTKKLKLAKQIDTIEERLVYGKLSKEKAEQLESSIEKEIAKIDEQLKLVDSNIMKCDELIEQTYSTIQMDYDMFDVGQKIALTRQMIEKIVVSKPDRNHVLAEVFPKVGTFKYKLLIDVMKKTATMSSGTL